MLYLILPPVIIVISIFLVIWLFYRRRNESNHSEVSAPRVKAKKISKKMGKKISIKKINTQKFKDILNSVGEGVKKIFGEMHDLVARVSLLQRKRDKIDLPELEENIKDIESKHIKTEDDPEMILEPVRPEKKEIAGVKEEASVESQHKGEKVESIKEKQRNIDLHNRPTISETVTHPEKTSDSRVKLEEILIERIASNPRDLEAYERLGEYYIDQKNYKDARECFSQVLKLSPKHVKAKVNLQKIGVLIDEEDKKEGGK